MKSKINSIVRHWIGLGAGALATLGVAVNEDTVVSLGNNVTEILAAILLYAVAQVWSFAEKKTGINLGTSDERGNSSPPGPVGPTGPIGVTGPA